MLNRRNFVLSLAATATAGPVLAAPKLSEDGLYYLDWYLDSFLDLAEDLAAATGKGKRFAVLWGLRGCPYCKRMHEVHLADPVIESFVREHFEILHLNIIGAREITDFDGAKLAEKAFAQKYAVRFTPTVQFFPETINELSARQAGDREVARMPGLLDPADFLAMFRFVQAKGYEAMSFAEWRKRNA
jgi:thioredoxin-related protein